MWERVQGRRGTSIDLTGLQKALLSPGLSCWLSSVRTVQNPSSAQMWAFLSKGNLGNLTLGFRKGGVSNEKQAESREMGTSLQEWSVDALSL